MNTSQKNDQAVHYLQSTAYPAGKIAIRYKFPKGPTNKVVLILHGATLPSFIFDLPPSPTQPSMMSYLADKGYAVYVRCESFLWECLPLKGGLNLLFCQ